MGNAVNHLLTGMCPQVGNRKATGCMCLDVVMMLLLSALVIADTGRCSSAMLPWQLANDSGNKLKLAVLQSNAIQVQLVPM